MKTTGLETQEMIMVSELRDNPAYLLLLTAIEAEIDFVADALDRAETYDPVVNTRALWKALRRLYTILRDEPHRIHDELQNILSSVKTNPIEEYLAKGPDTVGRLASYYQKYDPMLAARIMASRPPPEDNTIEDETATSI